MALTKEQIKEFKEKKGKAKACYELKEIADNIAEAGDKEWANKIYKSVSGSYDDSEDVSDFANRLCDELKDAEWSTKNKKALEENYVWALGPQFIKIAENIMFRLTKGKYARICIPLDKDEIYIGDTSNDLREISDIDSTMKDHINLAINLAKTEILRRLKNQMKCFWVTTYENFSNSRQG